MSDKLPNKETKTIHYTRAVVLLSPFSISGKHNTAPHVDSPTIQLTRLLHGIMLFIKSWYLDLVCKYTNLYYEQTPKSLNTWGRKEVRRWVKKSGFHWYANRRANEYRLGELHGGLTRRSHPKTLSPLWLTTQLSNDQLLESNAPKALVVRFGAKPNKRR
jgi:hypothetical protein